MNKVAVKFKRLKPNAELPRAWTDGSVGLDLAAYCISSDGRARPVQIPPHSTVMLDTGLAIEPPPGYMLFVMSRSGLARQGLFVTNAPGLIDPDYRGEIKVLLHNASFAYTSVRHGDRIAQLVGIQATFLEAIEATELTRTERGDRGFGSTGT